MNLKFAPDIRFRMDRGLDAAAKIDALLRLPEVQATRSTTVRSRRRRRRIDAGPSTYERPLKNRVEVHGWIVLDKPVGMTSTARGRGRAAASSTPRRPATPARSTRSPPASCRSPSARRPRPCPSCMDGAKAYRFTVRWGIETDTDDAEGKRRHAPTCGPTRGGDRGAAAALHRRRSCRCRRAFPPSRSPASAPTISRATARSSSSQRARRSTIHCARRGRPTPTTPTFEAECGKGTYVRAIARDLGRVLGCFGHVTALRRTRVGPFTLEDADTSPTLRSRRRRAPAREAVLLGRGRADRTALHRRRTATPRPACGAASPPSCAAATPRPMAAPSTRPAAACRSPSAWWSAANWCRTGCSTWIFDCQAPAARFCP